MSTFSDTGLSTQTSRNRALIDASPGLGDRITSRVIPFRIDIDAVDRLDDTQVHTLEALQIDAARTALASLASLAKIKELDHLGGGLDLVPALTLTLAVTEDDTKTFTIEHAHTSIGYYGALAARGYLDHDRVIDGFRRGLDIAGHVSWVPGGTQLNGGRLGIMVPVAVGQILGMKAIHGGDAWSICHCGDAGWISGQALNGFNGADLHHAPITFVMHRNGIQLSGSNKQIMDKDPRPIIEAMGITLVETTNLHEPRVLYAAYREARALARQGRPSLIYPTGSRDIDLTAFGEQLGILDETRAFAAHHGVSMDTTVWAPGSLMSYRDVEPMLECLFLVNELPGGEGHHDGHMKGRDLDTVLANPMLTPTDAQAAALGAARNATPLEVVTEARPAPGSPNLVLPPGAIAEVSLPEPGAKKSARAGVEAGYATVAKAFPDQVFVVSCDLDPSTKLGKARTFLAPDHQFEMSIEEQASALMADGLAMSSNRPQLNVVSTFAAFFEGIAREGMELWRYQRNLTGSNEGLNVVMHLSHVGACTGRDHFSGWSLDWINLALGYLPYLHRFYAPADAGAAFVAVKEIAAHYGGHIIGIPRDDLPVLARQDGGPLYAATDDFAAVTPFRSNQGARRAILAFGAPAFLAEEAAASLAENGLPVDVFVVNGLPLPGGWLQEIFQRYPEGVATIEDGIIGTPGTGLRGFGGLAAAASLRTGVPVESVGIVDPRIAPSDGHEEVWAHFGLTASSLVEAVNALG